MKRDFCVYLLTFPNGKKYVGQTCQAVTRRWRNGDGYSECPAVYHAIKKYGWDNVLHKVVADSLTHDEANELETLLISKFKTTKRNNGYNIQLGGTKGRAGLHNSKEHNDRIAESKKKPVYGFDKETGEKKYFFESISEASEATGISRQEIGKCCNKKTYSAGGYIWRHNANDSLDYAFGKGRKRGIAMLDKKTGAVLQMFPSIADAENHTGVSHQHISHCANGSAKSAGGYVWEYT